MSSLVLITTIPVTWSPSWKMADSFSNTISTLSTSFSIVPGRAGAPTPPRNESGQSSDCVRTSADYSE